VSYLKEPTLRYVCVVFLAVLAPYLASHVLGEVWVFGSLACLTLTFLYIYTDREKVMRERRQQRLKNNICTECGYDLTANVSGVCPECGTLIRHGSDTSNGEAESWRGASALFMAICAVVCIVVAYFGNGLAQRYQDHSYELLGILWLPSVALMFRATELSVRGVRAVGMNRRILITFMLCAVQIVVFVVWIRCFARGGK